MKKILITFTFLIIFCSIGCSTKINVQRVETGDESGIRYYLPQSFIVITPQEDGSMSVDVKNIANLNQAYAVSAKSYLSHHKLNMKLNNGLLTEVSMTQDSTAVAAETIKAAGEVQMTRIEAETAALKEAQTKKDKKQKEIQQVQMELTIAEAELNRINSQKPVDPVKQLAAQTAVEKTKAKLRTLQHQFASFNLSEDSADKTEPDVDIVRPGSVILLIAEDPKSEALQLVAMDFDIDEYDEQGNIIKIFKGPQYKFPSYNKPVKESSGGASQASSFRFVTRAEDGKETELKQITVKPGQKSIIINSDTELAELIIEGIDRPEGAGTVADKRFPNVVRVDSKTFRLVFKPVKPGKLELVPNFNYEFHFNGKVKRDDTSSLAGSLKVMVE